VHRALPAFPTRRSSDLVGYCTGAALENLQVQHPFYDRQVPVILGEHVTTDAGTGFVHTAPDHGADDFAVGQKYGIGTLNYIDDRSEEHTSELQSREKLV